MIMLSSLTYIIGQKHFGIRSKFQKSFNFEIFLRFQYEIKLLSTFHYL